MHTRHSNEEGTFSMGVSSLIAHLTLGIMVPDATDARVEAVISAG